MTTPEAPAPEAPVKSDPAPAKPSIGRRILRVLRWVGLAFALLVALLAAAYKGWIPGEDFVGDSLDVAKAKIRTLGFRREAAGIPAGSVVFLGSSSVATFPFAACYPGAPWVNRGIGGEDVHQLMGRLDASLPVARPAGIVIHAGQNDLRARALPIDSIVESIEHLADAVRARFPNVPITIVDVMPLCEVEQGSMARLDQLNLGLRALAERRGFGFVDAARPPLTKERGPLLTEMARPDHRHMHLAGYQIFARRIAEEGGAATEPLRAVYK